LSMIESANRDSAIRLKTEDERKAEQVRGYVDEYAQLSLEAERIKERMDWLKGFFETLATSDLKDTKLLTAAYKVQSKTGLEEQSMKYLLDYQYGESLILKLAQAMT
jgi:hypothetical protein